MRLPLLPHEEISFQIIQEQRIGYVLLQHSWRVIEANVRAFILCDEYSAADSTRPRASAIETFIHQHIRVDDSLTNSTYYVPSTDRRRRLDVNLHLLNKERHVIADDVVLMELKEVVLDAPLDSEASRAILGELSPRERDILVQIVTTGLAAKSIADKLRISPRTVEKHIQRIYDRLGVHSRPELTEYVWRAGGVQAFGVEPGRS
jgi:DNA-binding NarL/FixJ family response regulator